MYAGLVNDKVGTATICKRLNERGVPSPRLKKPWIVSAVYRLITNPLYKGVHVAMRYKYQKVGQNKRTRELRPQSEWIEVPVPAIVDAATWEAAQRQLKENKSQAKRNLKHEQLLSGLVYCGKCGRKMTIAYAGKTSEPKSYYVCVSQRSNTYTYSGQERCDARRIPTETLDKAVFDPCCSSAPTRNRSDSTSFPGLVIGTQNLQTALERLATNEARLVKQRKCCCAGIVSRWSATTKPSAN
jgi:site-specific DNA recombinase